MTGKTTEGIISKKELIALKRIIKSSFTPACVVVGDSPGKKYVKKTPVKHGKKTSTKKKTTLYLSQEILNNLNKVEKEIRTLGKGKIQPSLSKSLIVNQALSLILDEFAEEGAKSRLMQAIMQKTGS